MPGGHSDSTHDNQCSELRTCVHGAAVDSYCPECVELWRSGRADDWHDWRADPRAPRAVGCMVVLVACLFAWVAIVGFVALVYAVLRTWWT